MLVLHGPKPAIARFAKLASRQAWADSDGERHGIVYCRVTIDQVRYEPSDEDVD